MKQFLFLMLAGLTALILSCNPVVTKAQTAPVLMYRNTDTTSAGVATTATITTGTTDTLYDANTLYSFYTKVGALNPFTSSKYVITFTTTKISGTGTAKVFIQGSMDGKVWVNINANMLGTDGRNSDTLNIAAAGITATPYSYSSVSGAGVLRPTLSAAVYWVNSQRWFYLRAKIVGAGTQQTLYKEWKVYTFN